jgi:hypothetical protein
MAVTTLADLPFVERDPWPLLGLDPERREPDRDHDEYGWCRLPELRLEDSAGRIIKVERALVLALHTREHPEPLDGDLELEFVLHDDDGSEYSAVARRSEFLRRRITPLLDPRPAAVVLALCNPLRTPLPHPAVLGDLPLYYGHGDVTAEMQRRPGARTWTPDSVDIILTAERWYRV